MGLLEGVPLAGTCVIDLELGRFQALGSPGEIVRLSPENCKISFERFHEIKVEERQKAALRAL